MKNGKIFEPYNPEAEQATIGGILVDPDALINIAPKLQPSDFYTEHNGKIYEILNRLYLSNRPMDILTVADELEREGWLSEIGGPAYLTELIHGTPSALHSEQYARIVARDAVLRQLIKAAGEIGKLAYRNQGELEDIISEAQKLVLKISTDRGQDNAITLAEVIESVSEDVNAIYQSGGRAIIGLPTGLTDLDRLLGGLQRQAFYVIGGRPGMGKSALAVQMATHAAKAHNARTLIFSLEMSKKELARRILSAESGIEDARIKAGKIQENEWGDYVRAENTVSKLPVLIDDTPVLNSAQMRARALQYHLKHGLDLIIVDYLQLMDGDRDDRKRITECSRACKLLARELNIPVIALSQLSRRCEERHDKRPMLSDLRESGAIEADADVVMFMYRDDAYNPNTEFPNITEVIVSKHRAGPTGVFSVYFKKRLMTFVDLELRIQHLDSIDYGAHNERYE